MDAPRLVGVKTTTSETSPPPGTSSEVGALKGGAVATVNERATRERLTTRTDWPLGKLRAVGGKSTRSGRETSPEPSETTVGSAHAASMRARTPSRIISHFAMSVPRRVVTPMRCDSFVGTSIGRGDWCGFSVESEVPEQAADTLFDRISGLHGDLSRVSLAIQEAGLFPAGGSRRLTPAEVGPRHEWGFLLDVDRRLVRVFRRGALAPQANAPTGLESYDELAQLPIDAAGSVPNLRTLKLWSRCHVLSGWSRGFTGELETKRQREEALDRNEVRSAVVEACRAASLPIEELREALALGIERLVTSAPWPGDAPRRVFMELTAGSSLGLSCYWAFSTPTLELRYAVPSYRQFEARSDERLFLLAENPWRRMEVATSREALLELLEPDAAARLKPVLEAGFPKASRWLFSALDFVRSFTVPSEVDGLLAWRRYVHPDGRHWAVRVTREGYELRLGVDDPSDPPVMRPRRCQEPEAELEVLIGEQLAEGFQFVV